jgi:hypothetical protein
VTGTAIRIAAEHARAAIADDGRRIAEQVGAEG